jgi:hypothetical protein
MCSTIKLHFRISVEVIMAEMDERQVDFDAEADARFVKIVASGKTIPWAHMRRYLEGRVAGLAVRQPDVVRPGDDLPQKRG